MENLYKQHNRNHGYGSEEHYGQRYNYPYSHNEKQGVYLKQQLLDILWQNPKLKLLMIVATIVIVVMLVATLIFLLPIITKLIGFVSENGIQGFINALWTGLK